MARKALAQGSSVINVSAAAGSSLKSSRKQINTQNPSGDAGSAREQSLTLEAEEDLQESRVHLLFGPSCLGCNTQEVFQHHKVRGLSATGAVKLQSHPK